MKETQFMNDSRLVLSRLPERLAVCRLSKDEKVPGWALGESRFVSITRTAEELSIVCDESVVPFGIMASTGWRAFKVEGPLDFSMVGVISTLTAPLAAAGISVFAVSTYDTDYLLVKSEKFDEAGGILSRYFQLGHEPSWTL